MARTTTQKQQLNKQFIRQTVLETIGEIFNDPDYGLELQEWVKKRLKKRPQKLIPFEKILRKYQ